MSSKINKIVDGRLDLQLNNVTNTTFQFTYLQDPNIMAIQPLSTILTWAKLKSVIFLNNISTIDISRYVSKLNGRVKGTMNKLTQPKVLLCYRGGLKMTVTGTKLDAVEEPRLLVHMVFYGNMSTFESVGIFV